MLRKGFVFAQTAGSCSILNRFRTMLRILLILLGSLVAGVAAVAQESDSAATSALGGTFASAGGSKGTLGRSTGPVVVITGAELRQLPGVFTLSGALRHLPGLAVLNSDGQGFDPQVTTRGFQGRNLNGVVETDHVQLLVDGKPVNSLERGVINWDQIPLTAIEYIELARGGASALYGDGAGGGVINVVTYRAEAGGSGGQATVSAGSFGTFLAEGTAQASIWGRPLSAFGSVLKAGGFRKHSERTSGNAGVSLSLLHGSTYDVMLSGLGSRRQYNIPGPLSLAQINESQVQRSPLHQFDNVGESTLRFGLDAHARQSGTRVLSGSTTVEWRSVDQVRTWKYFPDFGSTQGRDIRTLRIAVTAQLEDENLLQNADRAVAGIDAHFGTISSTDYPMIHGEADDYAAYPGGRDSTAAWGDGHRAAIAGFLLYEFELLTRFRIALGSRFEVSVR